jgi:predicted ArsR family transcriptional regulator
MDVPILDQVKIQARVLVPLVKALQAELGAERANSIVRTALSDVYRAYGEKWWRSLGDGDLGQKVASTFGVYAAEKSLTYNVVKQSSDEVVVNVTDCRFAKFYHAIGAPELGFLLTCSSDYPMAEGFGTDVEFTRTQTIMQGASHCDFRYRLRPDGAA